MKKWHIVKSNTEKGFTLLETLVAVFILTLALTGPVYIATLALRSSVTARDGISARYLAEEVVEVIRNHRDVRSLRGALYSKEEWLMKTGDTYLFIPSGCFNSSGAASPSWCQLQINPSTAKYEISVCPSASCPNITFTPTGASGVGYYGVDDAGAIKSKFVREFYIESAENDTTASTENPTREAKLIVLVRWDDHGQQKIYKTVEYLHNLSYSQYAN